MNMRRSICSTLTDFSFYWVRVNSVFTEIPSQSQQLPFCSLKHKKTFHNGMEEGGGMGEREIKRNFGLLKTQKDKTEETKFYFNVTTQELLNQSSL